MLSLFLLIKPWNRSAQWLLAGLSGLLLLPLPAFAEIQQTAKVVDEPKPSTTLYETPEASKAIQKDVPPKDALQPVELRASALKVDNYPVDLAAVLMLVENQNLVIAQGQKNTEILQSRLRQRQVALLPSIDAGYSQNWQQGQQRFISGGQGGFVSAGGGAGGTGGGSSSGRRVTQPVQVFLQPQVGASWTLYPGGRSIYEILSARQRKHAADTMLQSTYQEQLARAAEDYYKLLAAYVQKGVVVRSIINAKEQVQMNQAKVAAGKGVPLDLSRARTSYAQQITALVQAENAIIQAEQSLLNRLNLDSTIHLVPNETEAIRKPLVDEDASIQQLIAEAVAKNPAIQTKQIELKALGYDYKTVRSDLIPSVTLRTQVRGSGSELTDLQRSVTGGFTISANLLENMGLQVPFRMQEQKKLMEQKVLEQKQLVRDIESRVMMAFLSSENYKSALEASEQELASAQESYDLAVGRFKAGYGINLDVLDAEVALTTARSNLVQSILNFNQAQVQLVEALGQARPQTLLQGISMQGISHDGKQSNPIQ